MSGKEELLSLLRQTNKKLDEILPKLNSIDAILILMSYMDILDNEMHYARRGFVRDNSYGDKILELMLRNIESQRLIAHLCIEYLYSTLNHRRTLSRIPPVVTLFVPFRMTNLADVRDPAVMNWIDENFNPETDAMRFIPMQLLAEIYATRIAVWQGYHEIVGKEQIILTIEFLGHFVTKKAVQTLLEHGIQATISADNSVVDLGGLSPEDILRRENSHPRRTQSDLSNAFPYWKVDVMELTEKAILSTELNVSDPRQQEILAKEHRTFYDNFASAPGFRERFLEETSITLDAYREITLALETLALGRDPPVVFLPRNKIIRKVKKKCGCSEADIQRILDLFTCEAGSDMQDKRFLVDGQNYFFTWCMIVTPFQRYVHNMFRDFVDGNFQGSAFEEECRRILLKHSCSVLKGRLEIERQTMPDDVSLRLWGKVKRKTDIDVIGFKDNCLLVIECKSEAQRSQRSETQLNKFEKYFEELCYKSRWVASNIREFEEIAKSKNFHLPPGLSYVVPMLVGTFVEPYKKEMIVSMVELDEIVGKIPTCLDDDELKVVLSKTELRLPVFRIAPAM